MNLSSRLPAATLACRHAMSIVPHYLIHKSRPETEATGD